MTEEIEDLIREVRIALLLRPEKCYDSLHNFAMKLLKEKLSEHITATTRL